MSSILDSTRRFSFSLFLNNNNNNNDPESLSLQRRVSMPNMYSYIPSGGALLASSSEPDSCDSGMFSEEEEGGEERLQDDAKKPKKESKWLIPSMVNNMFGELFKPESRASKEASLDDSQLLFIMMLRVRDFPKDASYYCVSPACQIFGKTKDRLPSKKTYSNGRPIPRPKAADDSPSSSWNRPHSPPTNKQLGSSSIDCFRPEQHSTVWIQLLSDILPPNEALDPGSSPPTLQIKHSCDESVLNYREDLTSRLSECSEEDKNGIMWYRYLGRQVESDLVNSRNEEETNFLSLKLRHLSRQVCGRCGSGFSMLFNRRLQCSLCQLGVCKNCCKKLTTDGDWICDACTEKKELQRQSCEWFYEHLHKSFNDFGSAKIMKSISHNEHSRVSMDENSSQVRDHIEKVVEALIGENIDQVNINRLVNDPQYDGLFKDYHQKLSDALAGLVLAIQLVMENRTIEDENVTPTTAHIKLKNLINQLIIDAGKFKKAFMLTPETLHHSFRPQEEENSYEDLLATAIINKVVTSTRQKFRGQARSGQIAPSNEGEGVHKSVCEEDEDCNASSEESGRGASATPSSTPPVPPSSTSYEDDSFSIGSRHCDETMSNESEESPWIGDGSQGQHYLIQEEIEEITTTIYDDDQITEKITVKKNPKIRSASSCPTLSSLDSLLLNEDSPGYVPMSNSIVPFPELGADVNQVPAHPNSSGWEENWFFRKQSCQQQQQQQSKFVKLSALVRLLTDDPVSMLVPNPNEDMRPQIGARDVDELSELSERNSVGSLEFSSSSSSEEDDGEEESELNDPSRHSAKQHNISLLQIKLSQADILKSTRFEEADVDQYETSVPPEVRPSTFTNRGNVDFLQIPQVKSSIVEGKILEITCLAPRSLDVAWFRNASPLHNDGTHYEIWRQKKDASCVEHFLRIYDLRSEDAGDYRVVAYNDDGERWNDFKVQTQEYTGQNSLPEIFCFPDLSHNEDEGVSKKFICQVKGHPEPRLSFFKDGKRLNRNENISIEYFNDYGEWTLEIRRISSRDSGAYEVLAENRIGSSKRSWSLSVRPKPQSAPTSKPPPVPCNLGEEAADFEKSPEASETHPTQAINPDVLIQGTKKKVLFKEVEGPSVKRKSSKASVKADQSDMQLENEDKSLNGHSSHNTPPGSIADREHRKWVELAVNMPNNPYSKENIEKRQSLKTTALSRHVDGTLLPKLSIEDVQEVQVDENSPSRIYCGLKSVDDSLYRRDYYINKNEDTTQNSAHNTSFQKELDFEPIDRSKNNKTDEEQQERLIRANERSSDLVSSGQEEEEEAIHQDEEEGDLRPHNINMSEISNEFSSICSLNEMQDSGMGSSCERSSLLTGKVEAEILRFQKDIEKVNKEKSELLDWQMKKIEKRRQCPPKEIGPPRRYYSSMDSLLSITEDSSSPDPPFERRLLSDRNIKNLNKKQVSISENSTVIISCYEDDDVDRFDDSLLPSVKKLVNKFMPSESAESTESVVKPSAGKTERKSKNRFNSIRTSNEIHSLTARSVPRQFREGLKNGLTHFTDKNIKIPGSDSNSRTAYGLVSEDDYLTYYDEEDESSSNVIYDSKKKYSSGDTPGATSSGSSSAASSCNTMESTRTPSPEHVGIPASRVRLTPKKRSDVTTTYCYTSDESTNNELYEQRTHPHHHIPPSARRKQIHRLSYQN